METKDCRSFKEKVEAFKWNTKEKLGKAVQWASENPGAALTITSTVIGATAYTGKKLFKIAGENREIKLIQCRHYDPRTGENWFTKRPLKSHEQLKLDREYKEGLSKGEILLKMGLLR